ncbi:MAG TPA: ATP-binding protein [Candidatus Obscuribacterales bacterium]
MFRLHIAKTTLAPAAALFAIVSILPTTAVASPGFAHMEQHGMAPNAIPGAGRVNGNGFAFGHNSDGNAFGLIQNLAGGALSNTAGAHGQPDVPGSAVVRVLSTGANGSALSPTGSVSDIPADGNPTNRKATNTMVSSGMQALSRERAPAPVFQGSLTQGIPGIHPTDISPIRSANQSPAAEAAAFDSSPPRRGDRIHIVAARGALFRRPVPSVIDLTSGQLLVSSRRRQGSVVIRAASGERVVINKSADVLVTADGDKLRVQNLTGFGKSVNVQSTGDETAGDVARSVSVDPGYEVVTKRSSVAASDIFSADGILRRNAVVVDNGSLGVSEVNLASLITNNQTIRTALHENVDPSWQKQFSENLIRTAAAISTVRGDGGFTSTAIASANESEPRNLGEAVSAAAHAAQAAGERVSGAVHEAIRSFHQAPPPPPPPPPPPHSTGSGGLQPALTATRGTTANQAQQATNSAQQQALAVTVPLQLQNIDTTRPRITDFARLFREHPSTSAQARQNGAEETETSTRRTAEQLNPNRQNGTSPSMTATTQHNLVSGSAGNANSRSRRSLIAANAAHEREFLHLPKLSSLPPAIKESIQKHPNIALAVGVVIFILLCVTAYFAYVSHRRALAIQAQMNEMNVLNRQLEVARDQALEASRLKSQFVANISHEIRTPMSAVLGTIGLLFDTKLDKEQQEIAAVLKESARSLLDVINDILDFSKIEAGMVHVEALDFSPTRLLREVADIVRVAALDKQIQLVTNIDLAIPETLHGDSFRLRQILLNLANNAVKFTAQGSVLISAKLHHIADNKVWLQFSVKDTGIGISSEARERLFQPFVQADGSTTRQFGGTGLGLSISKKLAELLGGTIELESALGKGSTFTVLLPLAPADGAADPTSAPAVSAPATTGSFTHRRVLVAEDSPVLQRIIKSQLEKLGFDVEVVATGAEAVEKAKTGEYSLVLMDWQMPVMDGLEATRTIRGSDFGGALTMPIIAMTAHAMEGHRDACLAAGMNDYISKPFSVEQLKIILERWCPPDNA